MDIEPMSLVFGGLGLFALIATGYACWLLCREWWQ